MARSAKEVIKFWKEKAIDRRLENKELKKRLKETKTSREKWKQKYMKNKDLTIKYNNELARLKKNLLKLAR